MQRIIKFIILVLFFSIVTFASVMGFIDFKFSRLKPKTMYSGCFKVWAHRGFFKENMENSIEAFNKAFDLGAVGTELDIFYDLEIKDYVVSHDYPYHLQNGRILKLEEVFKSVGERGYFWLDFKNLNSLSSQNAKSALSKLLDLLEKHTLTKKVFVESTDPNNLSVFSKAGLHTSYWIAPIENRNFFSFWFNIYKYKLDCLYGNFSGLSMHFGNFIGKYGKKVEKIFSPVPIYVFTINDKDQLMEFIFKENVKIILSDENYYQENACKV